MSATQLVGGALAAMTAAVIGAQLGVAGTVLGAAIGSVVAGAAGSLYTASLKHTKDKLASAFVGRVGETDVEVTTVSTGTEVDGWTTVTAARRPPSPLPHPTRWRPPPRSTVRATRLAVALEADPGQRGGRLPAGDRRHHRLRAGQRPVRLRRRGHHDHPGQRGPLGWHGHPHAGTVQQHVDRAEHRAVGDPEHRYQRGAVQRAQPAGRALRRAEPEHGAVRQHRADPECVAVHGRQRGPTGRRHRHRYDGRLSLAAISTSACPTRAVSAGHSASQPSGVGSTGPPSRRDRQRGSYPGSG